MNQHKYIVNFWIKDTEKTNEITSIVADSMLIAAKILKSQYPNNDIEIKSMHEIWI